MSTTHTILVNRKSYQVTADHSETPILYVLRNDLGLKGTRFGCGSGECGACMVLIDGRARRSCEIPVSSVEGQSITTIEGLGTIDRLHPLQQAFIDFQAGQCGYCLCGIIMTAVELIASSAKPSKKKIVEALEANLCRCGAHARIVKAVEAAWQKSAEGAAR